MLPTTFLYTYKYNNTHKSLAIVTSFLIINSYIHESLKMGSWVRRTITSPFKKAFSFFNHQQQRDTKKSQQGHDIKRTMDLQGEVMACGYEDVQVMWSILDKSQSRNCNLSH